ncbi:MAG: GSCFA domain-containing protein [Bacteroidales bacterium]|nr:GSCFA domain-containing protein [Bacteroidales bacterium]
MTNLFTEVKIPKSQTVINFNSRLMFVGSCFADNIGSMFIDNKFRCIVNPLGTLYNPLSIKILFDILTSNTNITEKDFFFYRNLYSSYLMHGDFSDADLNNAVSRANKSIETARNFLKTTNIVFITLGTAFVYYLNQTGLPVANCHKQPSNLFTRRLLTVNEATEALQEICCSITKINPDVKIVLTVSPIRHIADGAIENTLSKSTLLLSVNNVVRSLNYVEYFPSYEIMIDELRDYRFYESNLTHPSTTAREIIFDKITATFCTSAVTDYIKNVSTFMKSVNHKIIAPDSAETKTFAEKQLQRALQLENQIEGLDLSIEKEYFKEIINRIKQS